MGNQQGTQPLASYPANHVKKNIPQSVHPTVVINFPKDETDDSAQSYVASKSSHNFLGIHIPIRPRRHSEASASGINVSTSDLYHNLSTNINENKNKLLQVPGIYNRQRRKSVDNSVISTSGGNPISGGGGASIKFHKPSIESIFGKGRRSRRSSMVDQEPIQIKAPNTNAEAIEVPIRERYFETIDNSPKSDEVVEDPAWSKFLIPDMNTRKRRTRAVSMVEHNHNHGYSEDSNGNKIPTVFKYCVSPDKIVENVFLAGNMTNWSCVQMCRPKGEIDYYVIIGCQTGDAIFKFYVDGVWTYNREEQTVAQSDNYWNILKVQESDCDVFNALDCDSLLLKDNRKKQPNDDDRKESNAWGQEKPSQDVITSYKNKGPPGLPPHLLQVLLNRENPAGNADPVILHEPLQVSLNHLYAQSIRDNMLVLSTTHRYRKKCVTLVLYKPL
ncbi:uncharacterized protein [Lepeophtheirus salmonis]|uniref:uncharacterized protein isoform X1 n=1 Tax=Lepeophtheirus salmonis TaxID=72036 RepID=UPI001AEB8019|nr:uncharacterized protein LOC121128208 isoform X1 [Lepeophtheirus salmonis]